MTREEIIKLILDLIHESVPSEDLSDVDPEIPLRDQLAPGGRMILRVGSNYSQVLQIIKKNPKGKESTQNGHAVRFVPFVRT